MCGIFGIRYADPGRPVPERLVVESTDLMTHRGPDDAGYWVRGAVGLGHRRLSIIDLSPLGHQPMFNEDGEIGLVYNGEIYNYLELYRELRQSGHRFRSQSDTEVIIHGYEQWGFDCLQRFNGMFAFGLWDEGRQSLWVARDRLGVKPLYYFWDGEVFLFSSEIKPILRTGLVKPALNEQVLDAYFSLGYVPGPETMFRGIKKLRAGHYLCLKDGKLSETEYWDFAGVAKGAPSGGGYRQQLEELLLDSVGKRLRSDVPVGVFLSGGLDSSAVVALMSELVSDPIETFTVGYDASKNFSEEPFADLVAKRFNTRHHVFKLESDEFFGSLEQLVQYAEEPIVEPAAIALYHISKLARQSATVLLSGEGSDELFAGYQLYDYMSKLDRVQRLIPAPILGMGSSLLRLSSRNKLLKYGDWLSQPLSHRYQGTSGYLTGSLKKRLYTEAFQREKGDYLESTFSRYFGKVSHKADSLSEMLYVDTKTWLVDDLLLKADKMTMAASIELRVPFLDYRLVELAASFPSGVKLADGNGKAILKSVMSSRLPGSIVDRTKMGFPVPVRNWFGSDSLPAVRAMIESGSLYRWIEQSSVDQLLLRHAKGVEDNSRTIMNLLVLSVWERTYLAS